MQYPGSQSETASFWWNCSLCVAFQPFLYITAASFSETKAILIQVSEQSVLETPGIVSRDYIAFMKSHMAYMQL